MSDATYTYLRPSALGPEGLVLQTSGDALSEAAHPYIFAGFLATPEPAALGLLAVAEVARTRYFMPMSSINFDPVVTSSLDRLRFESFSGCCGVYARMDVLPDGLDGDVFAHGSTNVDVNPPLRLALARVGGLDPLRMLIGTDLTVSTMDGEFVERKVPLPTRWLRGFAEVQVLASRFDPRLSVGRAEATAFLRRLPTSAADRSVLWITQAGRGLRLSARPAPGAVCISGPGRLAALRPLLRFAKTMTAYGPSVTATAPNAPSTWELELPGLRVGVTLSPEPSRGFSGEGGVLTELSADDVFDDVEAIETLLPSQPAIDLDALAGAVGWPRERARTALVHLATAGRVGYDLAEASFFHRVLPFNIDGSARLNPRLAAARRLVDAGAVAVEGTQAWVISGAQRYQVRSVDGRFTCTCPWWGRYLGNRGPCKHALAVHIVRFGAGVVAG